MIATAVMPMQPDRLIQTPEAASQFGFSQDTFERRVKDGTLNLKPVKLGRLVRWSQNAVTAAIEAAKAQSIAA